MKARTLLFALSLAGCSFFGKQEPLHPQYYDPEPAGGTSGGAASGKSMRMGHVQGSSHLRERIAYHVNARELGFYERRRWTERPEMYLRRALTRELFERRGLTQIASGSAPTLEVELTDFSELKEPQHAARIRARVLLVEARQVRFEHTFEVSVPVEGKDFDGVPTAFSDALAQLADQIGERVIEELPEPPAL
ncbi:MAG TPA: ABC-type transport auxiliary lipoprotein family protein [Polyangiales bacterium]|nr:ABC-type transport auxiliary lipoprotein family protein [Polyangiales bacterium]